MGVAVAKHRLEILKLAKKDAAAAASASSFSSVTARLARRAGRCLARCARRLAGGGGRTSTSVVPRICSSGRASSTTVTVLPRICSGGDDVVIHAGAVRRRTGVKKMVLMITDGGVATRVGSAVRFSSGSSHKASIMFHDCAYEEEDDASGGSEEEGQCSDGSAAAGEGDIKWDSMFQDLKPT